ncbi:DUF1430 domain-containing protein [Thomasclavelia sp.]
MKKILFIVSCVFFLVSSYLFVGIYENEEMTDILEENSAYTVSVTNIQGQLETITALEKIAKNNNVNIQKAIYRLQEDSTFIIDIYIDINKPEKVLNNFIIDGKKLSDSNLENGYMSSKHEDNNNLIGVFSLLNKENTVHLRNFSQLEKENLKGVYSFSGIKNNEQFKQIKKQLVENNIMIDENFKNLSNNSLYTSKLTTFLPLLIILLILTCIYNYIMKFKQYSIMMLNGYDTKSIIKSEIKFYVILNFALAIAMTVMWMIYHWLSYGMFNYYLYIYLLLRLLTTALIIITLEGICGILLKRVNITLCLKNEKPSKEINIISIITKVCFCIVFLFTSVTAITEINKLEKINMNMDDWKESINYAYMTINSLPQTENGNGYEMGLKCQNAYKLLDEKGALLIRSDWYFKEDKLGKREYIEDQSLYYSDFMEVNNNYLKKYPIYDKSGNQLLFPEDENVLTILIPQKYEKNLDEIKELYDNYKSLRYLDQNLYNELNGLPEITDQQEIRYFVYTNDQKFFTYNPDMNKEEGNYIKNPIIMLTNANNRGTDIYLSLMSMGELIVPISNPQSPYDELYPILKDADASDLITFTPTVYSRVDQQQYELQQTLIEYGSISVFSLIGYVIMTIFVTMNYVESNKQINAVKTIMGYSFIHLYRKYYLLNIIPFVLIAFLIGIGYKEIIFGLNLGFVILIIDFIVTSLILWYYEKKSLNIVLKGE